MPSLLVHLKIPASTSDEPPIDLVYPGVLIDGKGSVLAGDIFRAGEELSVTTKGGESSPAVVIAVDTDKRLSLLKIAAPNRPFAPLSTAPLQTGEPMVVIGWESVADHPISQVAVAARVSSPLRSFTRSDGSSVDILPSTTALLQGDYPSMNGAILYTMRGCKLEVAGVAPAAFITGPRMGSQIANHGLSLAIPASAIAPTFTPSDPVALSNDQQAAASGPGKPPSMPAHPVAGRATLYP